MSTTRGAARRGRARRAAGVLLCADAVAVAFLAWVAFIATDEQGSRSPRLYVPLALMGAATAVAGWLMFTRGRQGSTARSGVALMLLAPAAALLAPLVFTGDH